MRRRRHPEQARLREDRLEQVRERRERDEEDGAVLNASTGSELELELIEVPVNDWILSMDFSIAAVLASKYSICNKVSLDRTRCCLI